MSFIDALCSRSGQGIVHFFRLVVSGIRIFLCGCFGLLCCIFGLRSIPSISGLPAEVTKRFEGSHLAQYDALDFKVTRWQR